MTIQKTVLFVLALLVVLLVILPYTEAHAQSTGVNTPIIRHSYYHHYTGKVNIRSHYNPLFDDITPVRW